MADASDLGSGARNERMGSSPISDTIADDTRLVGGYFYLLFCWFGGLWFSIVCDGWAIIIKCRAAL